MSVLLIGATGRTGRPIARRLYQKGLAFRVLIRDPAQQRLFAQLGAQTVVANLRGDFSSAFDGIDTVIYTAGSAQTEGSDAERAIDRDAIITAVDLAQQHGAKRFVVVSTLLAYDPERSPKSLRHYARMKRESDDYVIGSGLEYLVLRPGTLSDEPGTGKIGLLTAQGEQRRPVAREDVAHVVVAALESGVTRKVIGFSCGDTPIEEALRQVSDAA